MKNYSSQILCNIISTIRQKNAKKCVPKLFREHQTAIDYDLITRKWVSIFDLPKCFLPHLKFVFHFPPKLRLDTTLIQFLDMPVPKKDIVIIGMDEEGKVN